MNRYRSRHGKTTISIKHIDGGWRAVRNFSNERIYFHRLAGQMFLKDGIAQNYPWIEKLELKARGQSKS
ncbi:MAG: hypothetical protein H6669_06880 [Ardenticatenaceae bacterium]|nr:hypothetical protein [Ardenticatenaceae bacterium]